MKAPAAFDVFGCDLDGINLIEASAGTGKTWNICGLYLRLLLERGLDVQQILVVTFTNAATAELRERVRSRIVETLGFLRDGSEANPPHDPFVPRLVEAVGQRTGETRDRLALTLDKALQYFDEAAIFTIHGFCQRALADTSFSAGLPFSLELVTDDSEMVMEAVQDFWRKRVAHDSCPAALATHLQEVRDTPEKYKKLLDRGLAKPLAKRLWPADIDKASTIDTTAVTAAYDAARALWIAERDTIVAKLTASLSALNANSYKPQGVEQAAGEWDDWFKDGVPLTSVPEKNKLDLLSNETLQKRTKKGQITPKHAFFDTVGALLGARKTITQELELARLRLIRDMMNMGGAALSQRKRERRVISFNDMLYNLYAALQGDANPELAASLREKYPVALIDEFQDTDPLQFTIFDNIYRKGEVPAFLVGDPKQAIYSFRNADLHTYLRARQSASADYTLANNQRSTKGLIEALNGLFSATSNAFMLTGLDYYPVHMGDKERKPFSDKSLQRADLQLWALPQTPEGDPLLPKATAKTLCARATAAEIARLITEADKGVITIGARPLQAGDVAVLVRTHAQGSEMKRELATLNIGSVELSQASVFQSSDAEEVERVLIAINQPSRDALLRAALATEMIGADAARIAEISANETDLMGYLERFAEYREIWLRQGVGVMYRRLLTDQGVSARMLRRPDGERRLTNLLHLGEQIYQAAATHQSPDALLRWLATQRREGSADEVAQLRLESDRNLVQIITIHKAKGLEFPIVFCPFLWDGNTRFGGPKPEGREYHDADGTAVIDFRLDEESDGNRAAIEAQIKLEEAAESLRLIYVALTRAVYRCYVVAGTYTTMSFGRPSTSQSTKSLLNWLVAGGKESPEDWFKGKRSPADITAEWQSLAKRLAPHLDVAPLPANPGTPVTLAGPAPETLSALPAPKTIVPAWRFTSFSGMTSDAKSESAANDHDAHVSEGAKRIDPPPPDIAPEDILRFPRGPSAGTCLHAMFDRIDFTNPAGWNEAVARSLFAHPQFLPGMSTTALTAQPAKMASRMLADVMNTKLLEDIVLGSIPANRRLTELEFSLPSPRVSASALNGALKSMGYDVPRLTFRDVEGYLKGFIDLVFEHRGRYYVVDWKSNHLGYARSDYGPAELREAMAEHSYHLQYLLYSLAIDRYLKHRVPGYRHETHFGGIFYLFVRGVRPDWVNADGSPAGVFHDRPSAATLARLDDLFTEKHVRVAS
ncbi:MAG: exodeoxyribonuclease V subunit beta [Burkholderiales bacterium]|nr:exodeoxyribonuclease V subunit beta [Burkholderiales bacterium]